MCVMPMGIGCNTAIARLFPAGVWKGTDSGVGAPPAAAAAALENRFIGAQGRLVLLSKFVLLLLLNY